MDADVASWFWPWNINYHIDIKYDNNTGNTSMSGTHDGYPSYEVYRNGDKIYDYHQGNILQLRGDGNVTIKQ
jgi:hypothetical protein